MGSVWWLGALAISECIAVVAISRSLSRRFLGNYFAVTSLTVPKVEDAVKMGEGKTVEFKRAFSEDQTKSGKSEEELLKSVAAFANTNGGVIFIGVTDSGEIKGITLSMLQRDRIEQRIRQLVRSHIKPVPAVSVSFEVVGDQTIAKIAVASGDAPVYLLHGVIYIRDGSSDVQAQPEHLARRLIQFA